MLEFLYGAIIVQHSAAYASALCLCLRSKTAETVQRRAAVCLDSPRSFLSSGDILLPLLTRGRLCSCIYFLIFRGPEDTCFEFGVFPAILSFPLDYPLSPPKMRFTCEMFHPNIYPDGRVCISILHAPGDDPMGYESSAERWSPVQSVEKILLSVVSMLAEPNDESGANVDASKMWRDDREQFYKIAKQIVQKSLGL